MDNLNLAVYGTLRTGKGRQGYIDGYKLVHPTGAFFPAIVTVPRGSYIPSLS